jgi:hypothetical protein
MTASSLLKSLFTVLAVITVLHFLGLYFYWYFYLPWFDVLVHLLGGIFVAETLLYFYLFGGYEFGRFSRWQVFGLVLGIGLLLGILWEAYEVAIGAADSKGRGYGADTVKDLMNDLVGATIGFFYVVSKRPKALSK